MRHRTQISLCTLAVSIALLCVLPATGAAEGAVDRPKPPTSAELQAATPKTGVGALEDLGEPTPLPGGATQIFPKHRVVSLYGAPQMSATILGRLSPYDAGRHVRYEASRYSLPRARPTVRALELVVTIATADAGSDGLYRFRQSEATIARYLSAARRANARLVLDIQPGRSPFLEEVRALSRWLREPDVDLALDPEWNVGPSGVPGRTDGSVDARTVNGVTAELARIVGAGGLSQKMLVIHQFRRDSIRGEDNLRTGTRVATTLSFDGIGSASAKQVGYSALSHPDLFHGFCLFYRLDQGLMSPEAVMRLGPRPLYVLYQ